MISGTPFDRLLLGGMRDAERLAVANPAGITTVINLGSEECARRAEGIRYIHIPFRDDQANPKTALDHALAAIVDRIRGGRVLLHCAAGMSRSVAVAALYLHVVGYATYQDALTAIAKFREVDVSPAMRRSVESYLVGLAKEGRNGINTG